MIFTDIHLPSLQAAAFSAPGDNLRTGRSRTVAPSARPHIVITRWAVRVLALPAASQMGTPQEDESVFAILVAGDTPNNLHQDKLGEYVR